MRELIGSLCALDTPGGVWDSRPWKSQHISRLSVIYNISHGLRIIVYKVFTRVYRTAGHGYDIPVKSPHKPRVMNCNRFYSVIYSTIGWIVRYLALLRRHIIVNSENLRYNFRFWNPQKSLRNKLIKINIWNICNISHIRF